MFNFTTVVFDGTSPTFYKEADISRKEDEGRYDNGASASVY